MQNGFYRPSDQQWITLERIQIVGACNPPTDPGRNPLPERFLRHVPVVYVDYPGETSLSQMYARLRADVRRVCSRRLRACSYGTFNRAVLRLHNHLSGYADALTAAMVAVYLRSQEHFT